ncbi:hypothetical protein GF373_03215 [bacterium]|nr:hypothetical protein [bacterium]
MMTVFYYCLLCLPLLVYFLPGFYTALEHDFLLFGLGFYLFLRAINVWRRTLPDFAVLGLSYILLVAVYSIGWVGVWDGYLNPWGRFLGLYPLLVALPIVFQERRKIQTAIILKPFILALLAILWVSVLLLVVCFLVLDSALHGQFNHLVSALVLLLIAAECVFLVRAPLPLHAGKTLTPVFCVVFLIALPGWVHNIQTWSIWYEAGVLERAWVPHKHEDPEKRAEINQKPYQAAKRYTRVYQRILPKGEIPRYLNWDFFQRYRVAYQGMRARDAALLAAGLPFSQTYLPPHFALLKELWDPDMLLGVRYSQPNYARPERIWADFEIHAETGAVLGLDRFGRIFAYRDHFYFLKWEPKKQFSDAIDLELFGNTYVILKRNGEIITSKTLPIFPDRYKPTKPYSGHVVDLEMPLSGDFALIATSDGEVYTVGTVPTNFPKLNQFYAGKAVYVDLEIDPDGQGYYLLDQYGAIHGIHAEGSPSIPYGPPAVDSSLVPYWQGQEMAIDLVLDPAMRGLSVYNRLGEVFTLAVKPYRETYRPPENYPFRGLCLTVLPNKTFFAFETNGNMIPLPKDVW